MRDPRGWEGPLEIAIDSDHRDDHELAVVIPDMVAADRAAGALAYPLAVELQLPGFLVRTVLLIPSPVISGL